MPTRSPNASARNSSRTETIRLRARLDTELVRRGLADTRGEAQRLIDAGQVTVAGRPTSKPSTLVDRGEPILVTEGDRWASRAGHKLEGALEVFPIAVDGRRTLDVGASTGGFTDVLLHHGAASVTAVDVGYGQLLWRLATDPRVTVVDRTNFRTVDVTTLDPPFGLVTVDVSFISVSLLAANLRAVGEEGTDYVVLVKPQFEVGRNRVGKGGIVRDPADHRAAINSVAEAMADHDLAPVAIAPSPIEGAEGNREFLLHARRGASPVDLASAIQEIAS